MPHLVDRQLVFQLVRYGVSGGAAAITHVAVLAILVELTGSAPTLASITGFACATVVNYRLQHHFVFSRVRRHSIYFPRYLTATLVTLALNVFLFWCLTTVELYYLISQIVTIGMIVPVNFMVNRKFTFAA